MPTKPTALLDLLGKRSLLGTTGLQDAHIIGVSFHREEQLRWLREFFPNVDDEANFAVLPESERGSAILGVAAHFGNHNGVFDRFFFAGNDRPNKFLNRLRIAYQSETTPIPGEPELNPVELAAIDARYREQVLNFLDYTKVFLLYDEVLKRNGHSDGTQPSSLAFNVSDPRFAVTDDLPAYYGEGGGTNRVIRPDLLDNATVRGSAIYQTIAAMRAGNGYVSDADLVLAFPDLSRVLYPQGSVYWADIDTPLYRAIQEDVLTRDAVLSGVIALRGVVERVAYDDFEDIVASRAFDLARAEVTRAIEALTPQNYGELR